MSLPISAENLVKFGLGVPCGQLTTALETLIWTDSPRINGADGERGILLFGPRHCGSDHLLAAVLDQTDGNLVPQLVLPWRQLLAKPEELKTTLQFQACKEGVILVPDIDEIIRHPKIREDIVKLIYSLINSPETPNVFVVATATEPWTLGESLLKLCFKNKIHVPGPNLKARAALLGHYLREVHTREKLETCVLTGEELKGIANLESLKNATWNDLKDCVDAGWDHCFQKARQNFLDLRQGSNLEKGQAGDLNQDELRDLKETIIISVEDLTLGAGRVKGNHNPVRDQMDKFKEKWGVPDFKAQTNENYYVYETQNDRNQTIWDIIVDFIICLFEGFI